MNRHEQELADLYTFFQTAKFPEVPFKLNKYLTITGDPMIFIEMQILKIERYTGGEEVRDSLFVHLRELKEICSKQQTV